MYLAAVCTVVLYTQTTYETYSFQLVSSSHT